MSGATRITYHAHGATELSVSHGALRQVMTPDAVYIKPDAALLTAALFKAGRAHEACLDTVFRALSGSSLEPAC